MPVLPEHARQRESLADLALVAVLCVAMLAELAIGQKSDEGPVPALAVLAVVAAALPLLWRRRHPLAAFAATVLLVVPLLETGRLVDTVGLPAAVATFSLALHGDRRWVVPVGAALIPFVGVLTALYSPHGVVSAETAKNLAVVCLPLVAGCAIRDRRAYVRELHERLATAERTREEEALRRAEQERLSVARDVHDVVAHAMVAINVQAGVAAHLVERRPEQAHEALREIKRVSGDALADLRATLGVLRHTEAPTRPAPGLAAIDELAGGLRAAGVRVELDVDVDTPAGPLPAPVDAAAYRIVQEALTNVLRHAPGARLVTVRVRVEDGAVVLEVADDVPVAVLAGTGGGDGGGDGAGHGAGGSGNGVRGMGERAAAVGGTVHAGPGPDGGWRVAARLPLAPA